MFGNVASFVFANEKKSPVFSLSLLPYGVVFCRDVFRSDGGPVRRPTFAEIEGSDQASPGLRRHLLEEAASFNLIGAHGFRGKFGLAKGLVSSQESTDDGFGCHLCDDYAVLFIVAVASLVGSFFGL